RRTPTASVSLVPPLAPEHQRPVLGRGEPGLVLTEVVLLIQRVAAEDLGPPLRAGLTLHREALARALLQRDRRQRLDGLRLDDRRHVGGHRPRALRERPDG